MAVEQQESERLSQSDPDDIEPKEGWFSRWFPALKWVRSSPSKLRDSVARWQNLQLSIAERSHNPSSHI